jgi:hypothetical protein
MRVLQYVMIKVAVFTAVFYIVSKLQNRKSTPSQ